MPIIIGGGTMSKRQEYVSLELSDEKLEKFVAELRDKLLNEFWEDLPDGRRKDEIRRRIENSIISAFQFKGEMTKTDCK
jgi:hypothetical protein